VGSVYRQPGSRVDEHSHHSTRRGFPKGLTGVQVENGEKGGW
jgi:hypothetical protein